MRNYKRIDEMSNPGNKFIAPNGQELSLVDVEVNDDCIVAFFVPFSKVENWNDSDLTEIVIEFTHQDAERYVGGYECPGIEEYVIMPGDDGFDKENATSMALDELFGEYQHERRAA